MIFFPEFRLKKLIICCLRGTVNYPDTHKDRESHTTRICHLIACSFFSRADRCQKMFYIISHFMVLKLCVPGVSIAIFAPPNKMNEQFIQSGGGKASLRSFPSVFLSLELKHALAIARITRTFHSGTAFMLHKPHQIGENKVKHV